MQQNSVTKLVVADLASTCKQVHFVYLRNSSDCCSIWTVGSSGTLRRVDEWILSADRETGKVRV